MSQPRLPEPIAIDPLGLVENTYPVFLTHLPPVPDHPSRRRFEGFLRDRIRPPRVPRKGVVRVETGVETVTTTSGPHLGWRWMGGSAENHVRAAVTAFLLANTIANAVPAMEVVQNLWHRLFPTTKIEQVQESEVRSEGQRNQVAQVDVDAAAARKAADEIEAALRHGADVTSVRIIGYASDEYRQYGDAAIGRPDTENRAYAQARATRLRAAVLTELATRGIDGITIEVSGAEQIVNPEVAQRLEALRVKYGYASIQEAVMAFDRVPQSVPSEFATFIEEHLTKERGAKILIQSRTSREVETPVPAPERSTPFRFIPLIIPPLPRLRRTSTTETVPRFMDIPVGDSYGEFVQLYPEAVRDSALVHGAWKWARKYQLLFRETERIKHVCRLEYLDANGTPQRLRMVFIDHEPTPHMLRAAQRTLEQLSLARSGRVGEDLDLIAVFPTSSTGRTDDPKRIGMGLDIQYETSTYGVAIPVLGLVEMHMDPDTPAEELDMPGGPLHTLVHETLGHFTDIDDHPNTVQYITSTTELDIYRMQEVRWMDLGHDEYLTSAYARQQGHEPGWHITRMVSDGHLLEVTDTRVIAGDPRLEEAVHVRREQFPTRYSMSSAGELYAEGVTAEVLGFPFETAGETGPVPAPPRPGYADRYRASPELSAVIHENLGSEAGTEPGLLFEGEDADRIRASWQHTSGPIEYDSELFTMAHNARRILEYPPRLVGLAVPARFADDGGRGL